MTRPFLGFFGLMFVVYGIYCFFSPGALAEIAGIASATPTGSTELRAMYGGLQAGAGALLLAGFLRADLARPALLALGFLGIGLFSGRLLGAVLDDGWSAYTGMAFALEFAMFAGSFALLRGVESEG